tara:strand:- start:1135 stop:1569 length:435 start_codon:yes stop_codon:yes gene_type:complete
MKKQWYHSYHKAGDIIGTGNWCITEDLKKVHYLFMEDILHLLTEERIKSVPLKSIGWKNKHIFPTPWSGERYNAADIKYPGIITTGPNPYDNEYRMVDGRRRIHKLLSNGVIESNFYVIEWDELRPFFLDSNDYSVIERLDDEN